MKKIFILIGLVLMIIYISHDRYEFTKDSIRFRVIANSNSFKDIDMKEKVVKEVSGVLFKKSSSIYETRENIMKNLKNVENKIDNLFSKNNYKLNYNISYGTNHFPKKTYKGKIYDEGDYESLVIEIGESKGNNYFCILYPSLCVIEKEDIEEKKYNFKILEFVKKLF